MFAENGFECPATSKHENDFICPAVLVVLELVVNLFRTRTIGDDVLVKQNRDAASVEVPRAGNAGGFEMMMAQRAVSDFL